MGGGPQSVMNILTLCGCPPPSPQVCIAFCSAVDVKSLEAFSHDLAREALAAFRGCVRLTLYACR